MTEAAADTRAESANDGAIRVRRALISVSDKTGVADFAKSLAALGVEILSTGGTASALREAGLEVTDVSEFTGQEEILDGRVKTLHPRLHAALLARRDDPEHMATLEREGIEPIDLVCVNLYPFEQTVAAHDVAPEVAIENIDIGGPTMIRAAAKNHEGVAVDRQAGGLRRGLRRAGGGRWRDLRHDPALARQRGLRPDRPLRRRDQPLVLDRVRGLPRTPGGRLREGARPLLRREPAPAGGALRRRRGAQPHPLAGLEAARQGALLQQRARPRLGAARWSTTSSSPACVIVKHNNPCGVAIGADASRGLPEGTGLRPGLRLRRRDRAQPPGQP